MQQWIIGVLLAALASIISNFGLNLQKLCHVRNEKNKSQATASELSSVPLRRKRRRLKKSKKQREQPLLEDVARTGSADGDVEEGPTLPSIVEHTHEPNMSPSFSPTRTNGMNSRTNGHHSPHLTRNQFSYDDMERHYSQSITSTTSFNLAVDFHDEMSSSSFLQTPTGMRERTTSQAVPATPASALSAVAEAVGGGAPTHPTSHNHSLSSADPSNLVPAPSFVTVPPKKVNYVKQPLWQLGLVAVIGGSLLDFAALGFAAQSIVAPLGSLTLVSNSFFAPLLLKETISRRDMLATAAIVAGSCISVIFASHQESTIVLNDLFELFQETRFIVYAIIIGLSIVVGYSFIRKFDAIKKRSTLEYHQVSKYHRFSYAACAGTMGAQSVLFAKCTAELIANSIKGEGILFVHWQSYFILLGLGLTIFFQIRWLNSGLRHFDALYIVPVFQSFWILISVMSGMIFFGEYEAVFTHTTNAIMFPFGVLLTIVGVFFLSQRGVASQSTAPDGSLPDSPIAHAIGANPISRSRATSSAILTPFLIDLPEPDEDMHPIMGRIPSDADRGYVPLDLQRTVSGGLAHVPTVGIHSVDSYPSMISEGDDYETEPSTSRQDNDNDSPHRLSPSASAVDVRVIPSPRHLEQKPYDQHWDEHKHDSEQDQASPRQPPFQPYSSQTAAPYNQASSSSSHVTSIDVTPP